MASAIKKIRLEQRVMPVSSEEELSLVTLREQNKKLSNNYSHRIRIEADLRKRLEQLEETLKKCEDKDPESQLAIVNEDLRNRVEDLECELNKSRLNERRLNDDLERINNEFIELKRTLQSNPDSIRHNSASYKGDQQLQHNQITNSSVPGGGSGGGSNGGGSGGNGGIGFHGGAAGNSSRNDLSNSNAQSIAIDDSLVLNHSKTVHELNIQLGDLTEIANNRLKELEQLNEQLRDALLTIDRLRQEAKCIPRDTIIESAEYKTLQSHFSVLYNEATQLKTQLIESRKHMIEMKNAHTQHIERMEAEEIRLQREMRTNIVDLESCLSQARDQIAETRRENDRLLQANESTIKLDTELKKSLNNYKIQVAQKNNDIQRLKRKIEELKKAENHSHEPDNKSTVANNNGENLNNSVSNHSTNANHPNKSTNSNNPSSSSLTNNSLINHSPPNKKILELKEAIHSLQKQLDKTKSEEEALMQDLDVTGQAYEDMQEQNHRLLQQIEEKDEANFKLMSEHLKNNALQKHLNDEKLKLEEYGARLQKKIEVLERQVEQLDKHVALCKQYNGNMENELNVRNTLIETLKQEKLDLEQQLTGLKSAMKKISEQLEIVQRGFNEKASKLHHESFRSTRLTEDLESLRKKYERASKLQSATTPDEVLMEEIREYKEQLTCPSCKTKPKDAVLTKCFHVFCFDCLKTRVETRQRKCPKCNAQFGANDFHRLYLA